MKFGKRPKLVRKLGPGGDAGSVVGANGHEVRDVCSPASFQFSWHASMQSHRA